MKKVYFLLHAQDSLQHKRSVLYIIYKLAHVALYEVSRARFVIDNADGDRIVMCIHAVHSEGNQCKILVAPIELSVEMTLRLKTAIVGMSHVAQEMLCRKSHKGDAVIELVANTDNLVLIHVKLIGRIIVLL
jgi:hypothetical protein